MWPFYSRPSLSHSWGALQPREHGIFHRSLFILCQAAIDRSATRRSGGQSDFGDGQRRWRNIGHRSQNDVTIRGRVLNGADGLVRVRGHLETNCRVQAEYTFF